MCLVSSKALSVATHKIPIKKVFVLYYDYFHSPYFPLTGQVFKKEELPLTLKPSNPPRILMSSILGSTDYIYGAGFIHAYKGDADLGNRYEFGALVQDVSHLHYSIIICEGFIPEGAKYVEEDKEICATEMFITKVVSTFTT